MKAAVLFEAGHVPMAAEFPDPEPDPGTEPMTLVGAGIHQLVRSRASGRHYSVGGGDWPMVPGVDAVARTADGALVYTGWVAPPWGTMAERLTAQRGIELPPGADPLAVAAGVNPAMSGWLPLARYRDSGAPLRTVLVLGATGASGGLAVEAAFLFGAEHVIAAGRNAAALTTLERAGVTTVQLTAEPDANSAALAAAMAGRRPQLVLDYLWGPVATAALTAIGTGDYDEAGPAITYVDVGAMAGPEITVPAALLRSRDLTLRGSGIGSVSRAEMMRRIPGLIDRIADGSLPVPYRAFGLEDIAAAWAWTGERAVVTP